MPRKQRTPKTRRGTAKRLRDFDSRSALCFVLAWRPPLCDFERQRATWQTWAEFVEDYRQVRADVHETYTAKQLLDRVPFGDRVLQFAADHGLDALEEAKYEDVRDYPVTDLEGAP